MPEKVVLNPDVRELQIGVRELRNVTVYPLSVRDQLRTTSIVTAAVTTFFGGYDNVDRVPEADFAVFVSSLISGNLEPVVHMVFADEPSDSDLLGEMTNRQLHDLITTVYEVNYSFLSSLFQTLTNKMKNLTDSLSTKSLPTFATDTDIDPSISMASLLKKVDSPPDKH